jgi:hypothetical protein
MYVCQSWSFLSLLSLYCSLSKYNFNVLHHFKYMFSSILMFSWPLSFSAVLSKCIFILRYLCFLGKNCRCRMYTNFLDDGRYTDAVQSTQIGHASLFPLFCPDIVKPPRASWMQMNMIAYNVKYSCRYWSHLHTPSFQGFAISSMSGSRNTSISVPACFGPWIRIENIRYFLL